ncbi:MAG: hypothetical protein LC808_28195, partial [Actinobacteria bacterium]|nr:hypothetical protein [Actinomycetota bacterium]
TSNLNSICGAWIEAKRMAAVVERKDVVLAVMGAAGGTAGLTLVFLGFLVSARSGYAPATPRAVLNRYRLPAAVVLVAFLVGVVCVAVCTWWLTDDGRNHYAYGISVGAFAVQLALLVIATAIVVLKIWDD